MNRRGFLGSIGAALSVAVLDPERALWVPGRKMISVPKPCGYAAFMNAQLRAMATDSRITFGQLSALLEQARFRPGYR
jgi:hypothetical protein